MCRDLHQELYAARLSSVKTYSIKSNHALLNFVVGAALSALLLYVIWMQARGKLAHIQVFEMLRQGNWPFLYLALVLMPVNVGVEAGKWQFLVRSAQHITYLQALKSVLGGLGVAVLTPNRIGEYPGRILYLKHKSPLRLISVSVMGGVAQLSTLCLFGALAMFWYQVRYGSSWTWMLLVASMATGVAIVACYFRLPRWRASPNRFRWFRRIRLYRELLLRFSLRQQLWVLGISIFRFLIYTAQYLALFRWMHIDFPLLDGFLLACLFFWAMAIIPSIALVELGIRGNMGLLLFGHITTNVGGILGATGVLWLINVIGPAAIGALMLMTIRIFKDTSPTYEQNIGS